MGLFFTVIAAVFRDDLLNYAAALAYYFLFSMFPLMLLIAALFSVARMKGLAHLIVAGLARTLPHPAAVLVQKELHQLLAGSHSGLFTLGTVLTLYSAAQGFAGLIAALDHAYEVQETRPYWRVELLALGLTVTAGIWIVIALALLIFGRRLLFFLAGPGVVGTGLATVWPLIRWAAIAGFFILAIALLFHVAPNLKRSGWGLWPAALTTFIIWIAISIGLAFYINNFGNFNAIYGGLGAVIVLMLWFYLLALALLIGAEMHSELRRRAGLPREPKFPAKAA